MRYAFLACAMFFGLVQAATSQQQQTWVGQISDLQCGKNLDPECNRKCISRGVPPVMVVDTTGAVFSIANPETIKPYAGEHVELTGTLTASALTVNTVKILNSNFSAPDSQQSDRGDYRISADHVIGIDSFTGDDGKSVLLYSDYKSGAVRILFPSPDGDYEIGPGFAVKSPVELKVHFVSETQNAAPSKLVIQAPGAADATAVRMPQSEQEVHFQSGDASLAGTLILPDTQGKVPAIILLHGSGPLTRDSFGPYPHFFASLGFAVLIYDKRSAGASTGDYLPQDAYYPAPFAQDAIAAVHFLQSQPKIKSNAIGLWGSSEGGMLTTQVASQSKDVAFIINSSGFMMPLWEQMLYNREAELRADGFTAADAHDAVIYQEMLFHVGQTGAGWEDLQRQQAIFHDRKWFSKFFESQTPSIETLRWRWEHVYKFDPLPQLAKVHCPVLGVFGALDTSTPATLAAANMKSTLTKAGNNNFSMKVFPDANHSLTEVKTGANDETAQAKGQAAGLFDFLGSWLSKQTRTTR